MSLAPRPVAICQPAVDPEAEELVLGVLRGGRLAQGPMVERFEAMCARMAGTPHAVAMSNGTVTLEAILSALGVGPGDEVITSPLSFIATANAIVATGATVRFADVGADWTVDPAAVAALVGPRTAAVMPVHLYGQPADMTRLVEVADRHGLAIVEDAAQAHGAAVDGVPVGSFGHGSFSFYATKNVHCGEGGVVTTADPAVARHVRLWRNQGMAARYEYEIVGRNARLTELQAALGVAGLGRLDERNARRAVHAAHLRRGLSDVAGLVLPRAAPRRTHVWHQFTVLAPSASERDGVVAGLRALGVDAQVYYPMTLPTVRTLVGHPQVVADPCPRADEVVARCLSLPVHDALTADDLDHVVAAVREVLGVARREAVGV